MSREYLARAGGKGKREAAGRASAKALRQENGQCVSKEEISVAGTEGWRGAVIGEKAGEVTGAKASHIEPLTKT